MPLFFVSFEILIIYEQCHDHHKTTDRSPERQSFFELFLSWLDCIMIIHEINYKTITKPQFNCSAECDVWNGNSWILLIFGFSVKIIGKRRVQHLIERSCSGYSNDTLEFPILKFQQLSQREKCRKTRGDKMNRREQTTKGGWRSRM